MITYIDSKFIHAFLIKVVFLVEKQSLKFYAKRAY